MTPKTTILTLAAALVFAAGAASAQPARITSGYSPDPAIAVTQAHLAYSDADLATAAGARAMLSRIEAAAEAVCGKAATAAETAGCRAEAVRGAVAKLGHPAVRELASRHVADHAAW